MTAMRILVVEDDAMIGFLLAETLTGLGHEVCGIEATEAGAVAAAARHRPDLMIVDLILAEGTDTAAMERITRATPVPHLFMSGLARPAAPPGKVLLTKPFREADLVLAIGRALAPAASPA